MRPVCLLILLLACAGLSVARYSSYAEDVAKGSGSETKSTEVHVRGDLTPESLLHELNDIAGHLQDNEEHDRRLMAEGVLQFLESSGFKKILEKAGKEIKDRLTTAASRVKELAEVVLNAEVSYTYGIKDKFNEFKDKLEGLKIAARIRALIDDIKTKAGIARQLAFVAFLDILYSEPVQNLINKLPKLKEYIEEAVAPIKEKAIAAREWLKELWNISKQRTKELIEVLKEKSENSGLTQKLRDIQKLLEEKRTAAAAAAREKLLEILNSRALEKAISKLPEEKQTALREKLSDLKDRLQGETDATYGLIDVLEEVNRKLFALEIIADLTKFVKLLRDSAPGIVDDIKRRLQAIVESDAFQELMEKIPERWRARIEQLVEKVREHINNAVEKADALWKKIKDKTHELVEKVKDKAEEYEVVEKLIELEEMIANRTRGARQQLVDLLESEKFQIMVSILPGNVRTAVELLVDGLKALIRPSQPKAITYSDDVSALNFDVFELIRVVTRLLQVIKTEAAGMLDDNMQRMLKLLNSQAVKDFIALLPKQWRDFIQERIDTINRILQKGVEGLSQLVIDQIQRLIDLIKDKVGASPLIQKLKEIKDIAVRKSLDSLKLVKAKFLQLISSPYFEMALELLPEPAKGMVKSIVEQLRARLQPPAQDNALYGVTDSLTDLTERVKTLKFVQELKKLYEDIKTGAGVARDLALQKAVEIINSERVQNLINMIPESWRKSFVQMVEELRKVAKLAAERLQQLWEVSKVRAGILIDALKEDAEDLGITQKLREARDLISQKTTAARELGRQKLLEVLKSDAFKRALAKLEAGSARLRELASDLEAKLEDGVAPTYAIVDPREKIKEVWEKIDAVRLVAELKKLYENIKTRAGVARDLALQKAIEIINSERVQKLINRIPESWREGVIKIIEELRGAAKSAAERLQQLWRFSKEKIRVLIDAVKDNAEAVGITQKLREARDLLNEKRAAARALGRQKLLDLFESEAFQRVLSRLPEKVQQAVTDLQAKLQGGDSATYASYSISDYWEKLKEKAASLRLVKELQKLYEDIKIQAGVARDLALQKAVEFINSERVQNLINMIPESWRKSIVQMVEELREAAKLAGVRLQELWEVSKVRTKILIDALKEDAETLGIAQKLREARDLINEKTSAARALGREKLLELLGSEEFETALSKLPEKVQKELREAAADLKSKLENGVTSNA